MIIPRGRRWRSPIRIDNNFKKLWTESLFPRSIRHRRKNTEVQERKGGDRQSRSLLAALVNALHLQEAAAPCHLRAPCSRRSLSLCWPKPHRRVRAILGSAASFNQSRGSTSFYTSCCCVSLTPLLVPTAVSHANHRNLLLTSLITCSKNRPRTSNSVLSRSIRRTSKPSRGFWASDWSTNSNLRCS